MTPFDTSAAIAQASKWTEAGEHLVRALLAVEAAAYAIEEMQGNGLTGAKETLVAATYTLEGGLRDLRDDAVIIEKPNAPDGDGEAEWGTFNEACAAIEAAVVSVGAFIKKMEMEA